MKNEKFIEFVKQFRKYDPTLIESIINGYEVIFESDDLQSLYDELSEFVDSNPVIEPNKPIEPEKAPIKDGGTVVAYHGSNAVFDEFSKEKIGTNFPNTKDGFFFSDDLDYVDYLAKKLSKEKGGVPTLYKCQLDLGRTYTARNYFDTFSESEANKMYAATQGDVIDIFDSYRNDIISKARSNNCNSIHFHSAGAHLYVVFDSNQVKILNRSALTESILSNEEATALVNKYRISGKHNNIPLPTPDKLPHDKYILTELPLSLISPDEITSLKMNSDTELVNKYAKSKINTPIYAFKQRKTGDWYVSDGGHRITAALQRGDKTIPAIVPLKDATEEYSLNESAQDRYKYSNLNKIFNTKQKAITDYYQKIFESLYKNGSQISDMIIKLDELDDRYTHLKSMPIIFTSTKGDEAHFSNKYNHRIIVIPTPIKLYELANDFKLDYLTEVKKLFPDVDPEIAYEYLTSPGQLSQYKFEDGTNLFNSYISLWKEYKTKVSNIVNTTTRGIFTHEIVHALDDSDFSYVENNIKTKYQYYNSPHERNAYLVGLLSEVDMDKDFKDIISSGKIKQYLDIMSPNNKKRMVKRIHDIWSNKNSLTESIESDRKIEYSIEHIDYAHGQSDWKAIARIGDKVVGIIDFTTYNDEVSIKMVRTANEYKRTGIATELIKLIQSEYPKSEIDFGLLTDEGSPWYNSLKSKNILYVDEGKKRRIHNLHNLYDKLHKIKSDLLKQDSYSDEDGKLFDKISDLSRDAEDEAYDLMEYDLAEKFRKL